MDAVIVACRNLHGKEDPASAALKNYRRHAAFPACEGRPTFQIQRAASESRPCLAYGPSSPPVAQTTPPDRVHSVCRAMPPWLAFSAPSMVRY